MPGPLGPVTGGEAVVPGHPFGPGAPSADGRPALRLDLSLAAVRQLMDGHTALPVVEDGHLVGVVSRRDLDDLPADTDECLALAEVIRPRVVYCFDDSSREEALATMRAAGVDHLAVLGAGHRFLGLLDRRMLWAVGGPEEGTGAWFPSLIGRAVLESEPLVG